MNFRVFVIETVSNFIPIFYHLLNMLKNDNDIGNEMAENISPSSEFYS